MKYITRTIVAMGDSTTAGSPAFRSPLEAPPDGSGDRESQYAYWLMQMHPDWRVLNRGVNGERTDQIRARFTRDVVDANPDLVVIIAGVNDVYQGRSPGAIERELESMYATARGAAPPILVVCGSIIPFNTATPDQNASMHTINDWIREYCGAHAGFAFCDTRAAVTAPDQPNRLASSRDGLHPCPSGYRQMAVALEPVIRMMLRPEQRLR